MFISKIFFFASECDPLISFIPIFGDDGILNNFDRRACGFGSRWTNKGVNMTNLRGSTSGEKWEGDKKEVGEGDRGSLMISLNYF